MRRIISPKVILIAGCVLIGSGAAAAEPTLHDVSQAVKGGDYVEAQHLMDDVLKLHPDSARAHFVEAQILVREGHMSNAESELTAAERLNPTLSIARPSALTELREAIARSQAPAHAVHDAPLRSNFLITRVLPATALLLGIALLLRSRNRSSWPPRNPTSMSPTPVYNTAGVGAFNPPSVSGGSGILGSLATGAAVGAGMIAGESLMNRFLDGGHRSAGFFQPEAVDDADGMSVGPRYDWGGDDFGVSDTSTGGDDGSNTSSDDWT